MAGMTCSICSHASRKAIERDMIQGIANRAIARHHGVTHHAIGRHGVHIARALSQADRKKALDALRVSTWLVKKLVKVAKTCEVRPDQFLNAADSLNRSLLTLGRLNGQIASNQVQAMFINLGVSGEPELQRAVQLARAGSQVTLEAFGEELVTSVRFLLRERPEWRSNLLAAFSESGAESGAWEVGGEGGPTEGANGKATEESLEA